MFSKFSIMKPLAVAALLATAGVAQATITVYTSLAAFSAATTNPGTDTFAGLSITSETMSPLTRNAGSYSYTANIATTPAGTFFGVGTTANPWLSTSFPDDTISFSAFSAGVVGFGGNFFGSYDIGSFASGDLTLTATDASGTVTQTLNNATKASFLGFVSSTGMISASLVAVQPKGAYIWPTADNIVLAGAAQVSTVPEPSTYAMLLGGLGILGLVARRRQG